MEAVRPKPRTRAPKAAAPPAVQHAAAVESAPARCALCRREPPADGVLWLRLDCGHELHAHCWLALFGACEQYCPACAPRRLGVRPAVGDSGLTVARDSEVNQLQAALERTAPLDFGASRTVADMVSLRAHLLQQYGTDAADAGREFELRRPDAAGTLLAAMPDETQYREQAAAVAAAGPVRQLLARHAAPAELHQCGVDVHTLLADDVPLLELLLSGYSALELLALGFTLDTLVQAGLHWRLLRDERDARLPLGVMRQLFGLDWHAVWRRLCHSDNALFLGGFRWRADELRTLGLTATDLFAVLRPSVRDMAALGVDAPLLAFLLETGMRYEDLCMLGASPPLTFDSAFPPTLRAALAVAFPGRQLPPPLAVALLSGSASDDDDDDDNVDIGDYYRAQFAHGGFL